MNISCQLWVALSGAIQRRSAPFRRFLLPDQLYRKRNALLLSERLYQPWDYDLLEDRRIRPHFHLAA